MFCTGMKLSPGDHHPALLSHFRLVLVPHHHPHELPSQQLLCHASLKEVLASIAILVVFLNILEVKVDKIDCIAAYQENPQPLLDTLK